MLRPTLTLILHNTESIPILSIATKVPLRSFPLYDWQSKHGETAFITAIYLSIFRGLPCDLAMLNSTSS